MKKNIAGTKVFRNAMREKDKLFDNLMSRGDAGDAHADAHEHEHAGDVILVLFSVHLFLVFLQPLLLI